MLFIDRLFIVLTPGLGVSWHLTIVLPLGMFRSSRVRSRGWSRDMHITCDSITHWFCWVHFYAVGRDDVSKVGNLSLHEVALQFASVDFVFSHDLEYCSKVLEVFFSVLAVDSDVVDIYHCEFS